MLARHVVPMMKKSITNKLDWEKQVKLAVFAYRCSPHESTGYSPFEIIYGKNVRGPLEVLKESWERNEKEQFKVCKWIEQLQQRLQVIRDSAKNKEVQAKENMKRYYDKKRSQENSKFFGSFDSTRSMWET